MSSKSKRLFFYLLFHICAGLSFGLADPSVWFSEGSGVGESRGRLGSVLPWRRSKCSELQSACARGRGAEMGGAVPAGPGQQESPAGEREPDAASSPLQHLQLPLSLSATVSLAVDSLPSSLLVACPGGVREWSLVEPGVPPRWKQGRCQDPWGGPAPHQSCLGLNVVLALKTNVLFSVIFSASESSV